MIECRRIGLDHLVRQVIIGKMGLKGPDGVGHIADIAFYAGRNLSRNYARRKHRTDRNGTDRSNVARLLCYDSLIVNGSPVKSRASQLRRGLLQVMGVIEYPNSDGSYFRCICHL